MKMFGKNMQVLKVGAGMAATHGEMDGWTNGEDQSMSPSLWGGA